MEKALREQNKDLTLTDFRRTSNTLTLLEFEERLKYELGLSDKSPYEPPFVEDSAEYRRILFGSD